MTTHLLLGLQQYPELEVFFENLKDENDNKYDLPRIHKMNSLTLYTTQSPPLTTLTHYQTTNFRFFQKEFTDENFKFDKNGRKLSKKVENTVGKGENKQFPLFPQCFQKACFPEASKGVIVWEWVKGEGF